MPTHAHPRPAQQVAGWRERGPAQPESQTGVPRPPAAVPPPEEPVALQALITRPLLARPAQEV